MHWEAKMVSKHIIRFIAAALCMLVFVVVDASAGGRVRSGSYQGRRSSGTWQQSVERAPGQVQRSTTWQNQRGQGSRVSSKDWNKESGTGSYSSTTTRANGQTASRQGTVTREGRGVYIVDGSRTGPNGKVTRVDRAVTRNSEGATSVHSVFTGAEGKSKSIDSTILRTEDGRTVTGTYATSGGKSGTFDSTVHRTENGLVKEQSRTNQDDKTWQREISRTYQDNAVNRQVIVTSPLGQTRGHTGSVTVDRPAATD
jgi:hypothetical protein